MGVLFAELLLLCLIEFQCPAAPEVGCASVQILRALAQIEIDQGWICDSRSEGLYASWRLITPPESGQFIPIVEGEG